MLDVKDDHLVVESKGIYSIENFLTARRLMYWQVYLHKTSVAYEKDAHQHLAACQGVSRQRRGLVCPARTEILFYTMISTGKYSTITRTAWKTLSNWTTTIFGTALKVWSTHPDRVLSTLSMGMVNRNIFKVEISTEPFSEERKEEITRQIGKQLDIPLSEAGYFISTPSIEKNMYDPADDSIDILYNDGSIKNISRSIGHAQHLPNSQKSKKILLMLSTFA